jgi:tRNA(His) guanylyltransferase
MKFDEVDARLRVFETAHDHCALLGLYLVARLDGRGFTRLTKEVHPFEAPFDERMRDYMTATTQHLLECGFRMVYGYTQSDEISLLLHPDEDSFGRKLRKYMSVLAGEASAKFSLLLGRIGVFDCRISQLPRNQDVVDYFRWRQEDAGRNSLNAHCYWLLRKQGQSVAEATGQVNAFVAKAGGRVVLGILPQGRPQPPHPADRRNHPPPASRQPGASAWRVLRSTHSLLSPACRLRPRFLF